MINLYDDMSNLGGLVYIRTWRLVNVRIGQDAKDVSIRLDAIMRICKYGNMEIRQDEFEFVQNNTKIYKLKQVANHTQITIQHTAFAS